MRKSLKLEVVELNRYSIMLVVAAIMLSSIGLTAIAAAECCDIKCVWEPCGEKVEQGDVDAVYALKPIKAMWAYQDADSDGRFDDNDVLIIDTVLDQDAQGNWIGAWVIEEGDVRLSNYHETPANTKVISTDGDRGKPLKELPGGQMVVGFVDVNNNIPPHYDLGDPLYADTDGSSTVILNDVRLTERTVLIIDTVLDQDAQGNWIGAWVIEEGDVRLSNYHETPANTKVISTDGDRGKPLKELPGGQMVVGFVDVNNNIPPHYDLGDPLYADTDGSSTVTPNDVRLTERTVNIKTYPVYSRVQSDDWDVGNDLRDPVTYETDITTNSVTLLGYIDSDCNCHWTCPDKLYLQQITGTIADNFSTIGDLRLYIPPEAIADEDWPECGTKVEQCNKDAVYVLAKRF
jgi:GNAT superfamily N-acetyltransferase